MAGMVGSATRAASRNNFRTCIDPSRADFEHSASSNARASGAPDSGANINAAPSPSPSAARSSHASRLALGVIKSISLSITITAAERGFSIVSTPTGSVFARAATRDTDSAFGPRAK